VRWGCVTLQLNAVRVLEKMKVAQLVKTLSAFYGIQMFTTVFKEPTTPEFKKLFL